MARNSVDQTAELCISRQHDICDGIGRWEWGQFHCNCSCHRQADLPAPVVDFEFDNQGVVTGVTIRPPKARPNRARITRKDYFGTDRD